MRRRSAVGLGLLLVLGASVLAVAQDSHPGASPSVVPEASPSAEAPATNEPGASPLSEEVGMRISSPAFEDEGDIPVRFTCDGDNVSPALTIEDLPPDTVSLVLIMDDPDAPAGTWDHWVAYDIPPTTSIPEGVETLGTPGTNSWDRTGYGGPCPPGGTHRYFFVIYALDRELGWEPGADKGSLLDAIHGHVLEEASLLGFYSRE